MSTDHKIGLIPAILINLNVMVSSGIFINIAPLLHLAGSTSFLAYFAGAICLFPVVVCIALLARALPKSGGLYVYSKTYLSEGVGFISGWSYYIGKCISAGLLLHLLVGTIQQTVPFLQGIPHIALDAIMIALVIGMLIAGVEVQGSSQYLFMIAKLLPMLLIIGMVAFYGDFDQISFSEFTPTSLFGALSTALFAMIGFELATSIAHLYRRSSDIAPAIMISFSIVSFSLIVMQLGVTLLISGSIGTLPLKQVLIAHFPSITWLPKALYMCIYISVFGGVYGLFASNPWNLHTLIEDGFFPAKKTLVMVLNETVPVYSLLISGVLSFIGILIAQNQIALQNMVVFCVVIAFMFTVLAAMVARKKNGDRVVSLLLAIAAFFSTLFLMYLALHRIYMSGVSSSFLFLYLTGIVIAVKYKLFNTYMKA